MLLVLGGLLLGAAAFLVAEAATLPARQRHELLKRAANYGSRPAPRLEDRRNKGFGDRVLAPLFAAVARFVLRVSPRTTRESTAQRLLSAGLAQSITPDQLLGAKGLATAFGVFFGFLIGTAAGKGSTALILIIGFGLIGLIIPDFIVNSRISRRREAVQAALPDALDLLAVSVEAGLGFDGAVAKLTEYMEGPLIEEFSLTLNEMRIGESRADALRRMAFRVDCPELSSFVHAVVQADDLGASMGNILRVQAADSRIRRQLSAEEKAAKAPIKMLIPTAVFILPATFIVILGPAVLNWGNGL
jgi:tight adherence protein C